MTKPFYEDYANHAMRFYARNPALNLKQPGLKKIDVENWMACNEAIKPYKDEERAIIINVFKSKCTMTDAVKAISGQLQVGENSVWQLLNRAAFDFAKKRGLI